MLGNWGSRLCTTETPVAKPSCAQQALQDRDPKNSRGQHATTEEELVSSQPLSSSFDAQNPSAVRGASGLTLCETSREDDSVSIEATGGHCLAIDFDF